LPATWTESRWVDCWSVLWEICCKLAGFLFGAKPDDLLKPSRFILEQSAPDTVPVAFEVPPPVLYLGDSVQPLIDSPIMVSPAQGAIPAGVRSLSPFLQIPMAFVRPGSAARSTFSFPAPRSTA
jgi:hypothetical protein